MLTTYAFLGAIVLGILIRSALEPGVINRKSDWLIILLLAVIWPYGIYLIWRHEVKK
jgi:hypothetical protein